MSDQLNMNKSCKNCPSFLKAGSESVQMFKKSVGSPMCAKYGHVLGRPSLPQAQSDKLAIHFANKCDSFGDPKPAAPAHYRLEVVLPDIDVVSGVIDENKRDLCTTCNSCANFVRDEAVATELGWPAGLCAAKGKLILPDRRVIEARNCGFRQFGTVRATTQGLHFLPEYEDAFNLATNPVKMFMKNKDKALVESWEYPTDRDVSEIDKNGGIRAWRKILDPMGSGNEAFLPIYDRDYFDVTERAKIPQTGEDAHPELYIDHFGGLYLLAVAWSELDETPALWGQAGVGKTELYRHAAWLMDLPFERISITASTELDDLAGKTLYSKDKGTYFQYGRMSLAWQKPCVICLDEPNTGQPDVWQYLRPLIDNSKQMVLDMNDGEHLTRHTDAFLGLAMNPSWDVKNVGAQQIGDADASRLFHIYMEIPPPELEREIIKARVALDGWEIDDARLATIMAIAEELRALCKDDSLPITWAIRPQIKVARASRWFDMVTAYKRAVGDYLDPDQCEMMLDVVRAHVQ